MAAAVFFGQYHCPECRHIMQAGVLDKDTSWPTRAALRCGSLGCKNHGKVFYVEALLAPMTPAPDGTDFYEVAQHR